MHIITLYLNQFVETAELRKDLDEIVAEHHGKKATYVAFPLPYAVGLAQVYEIPAKGTIIAYTNDAGKFYDEALHIPGGELWYNARICLLGFKEDACEFQWLKESFEYLQNKYGDS